ncbi:unnamed protein product, partial [Discosporangium mesarthrocarpum]
MESSRRRQCCDILLMKNSVRQWRSCSAGVLVLASWLFARAAGLLQFDDVPNRNTNERDATFSYTCTPLDVAQGDICAVEWSLDSSPWRAISVPLLTVNGLLDGVHTLRLRHKFTSGRGRNEEDLVDYTWTVDTVPPDTLVDTGPPHEGDAPRPEEADPFLFFTFHCSEDNCRYRYQFDNRLELSGALE